MEKSESSMLEEILSNWGKKCLFIPSAVRVNVTMKDVEVLLNHSVNSLSIIDFNHNKLPTRDLYYQTYWDHTSLDKTKVNQLIEEGCSFILHNCTEINREIAALANQIEESLPGYHTDLHIYISTQKDATTYAPHRDRPQHKIFIQLMGKVHWKIYDYKEKLEDHVIAVNEEYAEKNFKVVMDVVAKPGDVIYMPDGVFHKVETLSPRVSLSFPIVKSLVKRKDRTTISLEKYFNNTEKLNV